MVNPAAWTCFRMELRRRWRPGAVGRVLVGIAAITAVQVAVTSLVFRPSVLRAQWGVSAWVLVSSLGLSTPLTSLGSVPAVGLPPNTVWVLSWMVFSALATTALFFLLPACAAGSVAPDREEGRLHELILAGLKPAEILLAKGVASTLPFLGVVLLLTLGELLMAVYYRLPMLHATGMQPALRQAIIGGSAVSARYAAWSTMLNVAAYPLVFVAQAGTLVCLSALSRRLRDALVLCYGAALIRSLILGTVVGMALMVAIRTEPGLRNIIRILLSLGLQWAVFGLIARHALRSLKHPDEPLTRSESTGPDLSLTPEQAQPS
jgi:hypothetical protein